MEKLTDGQKKQLLNDVLDPERIVLICDKHFYYGNGAPTQGCSGCWSVYFTHVIANTPPHKRDERLDQLEALVNHLAEAADKGEFDISLYKYPKVTVEHEAD
jgi:hypothetical protein